ncbi:MAG: hypothetical protein PHX70_13735 [Clostridium sp.]|nr:hypothetical protein [Clostridium sp.]
MDKSKILIIFLAVGIVTLGATNYNNYCKNLNYESKISSDNKTISAYKKAVNYNKSHEKILKTVTNSNADINNISTQFLNAYMDYTAQNKDEIYKNIIPYSTPALQSKLKVVQNGSKDLQSDTDYKMSGSNIRIYNKDKTDDYDADVLVLADENISVNSSSSTTTVLFELKLKKLNNKWFVDDEQMYGSINNNTKNYNSTN